jgi:hypothetical protein
MHLNHEDLFHLIIFLASFPRAVLLFSQVFVMYMSALSFPNILNTSAFYYLEIIPFYNDIYYIVQRNIFTTIQEKFCYPMFTIPESGN